MKIQPTMRLFRALALGTLAIFAYAGLQAQNRKITLSKFTVTENATQFGSSVTGLELKFDLTFNWREAASQQQSFDPSFRLVQNGQVIISSDKLPNRPSSIYASNGTVSGKEGMVANACRIFIPYMEIPLESGPQKAEFILTMRNSEGTYTDCAKAAMSWTHRKLVLHSMDEQEFTLQKVNMQHYVEEFSSKKQGMALTADVGLKYGPDESRDAGYNFALLIRSGGKVVYDSRSSNSFSDKTRTLRNELLEGKAQGKLGFQVNYEDLKMDGPAEAEIVFVLLGAEGGPREAMRANMTVNAPVKYNYEDQEFTLKTIEVNPAVKDGVQGISVHYSCGFKYNTVLRNPEKGRYFFYLALFDANGKLAIDPARAPKSSYGTAHLMDGQLPVGTSTEGSGDLFIPLYMLTVPAGTANLKYALMVSDANLATKFPPVGQGTVTVQRPAERRFKVSMERLEMIDANYDAEFIPPGSHLPELQYQICVGDDAYYSSDYNRNSLTAIPGSVTLRLCEGDELNMRLYDVDSGFFNASDLQGRWKIEYAGKPNTFLYEVQNQGQVLALRIALHVLEN